MYFTFREFKLLGAIALEACHADHMPTSVLLAQVGVGLRPIISANPTGLCRLENEKQTEALLIQDVDEGL